MSLPHNIEAEQSILGALLNNNGALERIETLRPEHFYEQIHAEIFSAICDQVSAGRSASPVTIKDRFANHAPLSETLTVGQYIARLESGATTTIHIRDYAETVRSLAIRRALIDLAQTMLETANDGASELSAADLISEAEACLFALGEQGTASNEMVFHSAIDEALTLANEAYGRGGSLAGMATGFRELDAMMGGLQKSDLVILAGRPAMGKTALATNIAFNAARSGRKVYFSSQEMSGSQLALRILGEQSDVSSDRLRRGRFDENELRTVMNVAGRIRDIPITIDPTGGISLPLLAQRSRRHKRRKGLDLLIIDYLQLMSASGRRGQGRVQEITEITMGLKALAKELDVPIIALSQLSRKVEERADKRPQLADLRESGSIEQDADVVMFVYRDDYYLAREEPDIKEAVKYSEWQNKVLNAEGSAEVILAKQRHGPTGIVKLAFNGAYTRFSDLPDQGGLRHVA